MKLAKIFGDGMVVQQGKPVRIFGEADGAVTLTFAGETKTVSADGRFLAEFGARPCGGPYELTVSCGAETVTVHGIMVGEVILFSGQSNMQFRMMAEATPASAYATDPMLRIFECTHPEPCDQLEGWHSADAAEIGKWSALAWLVGRLVRERSGCAVGAVVAAQGASMIHSWIDETIWSGSELAVDESLMHPDVKYERFTLWNKPAMLYHYMLEPLFPYSFGSVVWYQGESNTAHAEAVIYDKLLAMMIANWRERFMDAALPFCIVQIADYDRPFDIGAWHELQAAQLRAAETISRTVCVRSADVCETGDIHPSKKAKLAGRVADALYENGYVGGNK